MLGATALVVVFTVLGMSGAFAFVDVADLLEVGGQTVPGMTVALGAWIGVGLLAFLGSAVAVQVSVQRTRRQSEC